MITTEVCYIQTNANSPILTSPLLHYTLHSTSYNGGVSIEEFFIL